MGNSILVALKPHSRGSSTGFSSTYFSVLSHLGTPVLTQRGETIQAYCPVASTALPATQTTGAWAPKNRYIFSERRMNGRQPQMVFEPADDKTAEAHYPFHSRQRGVPLIALTWNFEVPACYWSQANFVEAHKATPGIHLFFQTSDIHGKHAIVFTALWTGKLLQFSLTWTHIL